MAATRHCYGRGQALLLGSFLGLGALAHRAADPGTDDFLAQLLCNADVLPDRCGGLLRRRRLLEEEQAWFFVNPGADACSERVELDGLQVVADLTGDALDAESADNILVSVPGGSVSCLLLRHRS